MRGVARAFVVVGLLGLTCRPAVAFSCQDVRSYVRMYGVSAVLAYARSAGATPQQIQEGRACLDRDRRAKRRFGRISSGAWNNNN